MTLQYSYWKSDEWYDLDLSVSHCFYGDSPTIFFREKPLPVFEPDYYQNKYDPHDIVFWHHEPSDFEDWIRVDVYPHTN